MKHLTGTLAVILLALCSVDLAQAQFALGSRYSNLADGYWHDVFISESSKYQDQLLSFYGAYWFRLKEKRVEFLPEVGYFTSVDQGQGLISNSMHGFYGQFNTDIYFLDFASDCNCPTFSKQNDFFKRGLFLELSPGVEFRNLCISSPVDSLGNVDSETFNQTIFRIACSLGLDIGLSDLMTITPLVGFSLHTGTSWDGLEEYFGIDDPDFDPRHLNSDFAFNIGLRFLFRPDYVRGRR